MTTYYTYTWLREDGTPYYVGKGCNGRADRRGGPGDLKRRPRLFWPDEHTAFAYERYLIDFWGRLDTGTGVLCNRTDGGDSPRNYKGKNKGNKRPDVVVRNVLRSKLLTREEKTEQGRKMRASVKTPVYPPVGIKPRCRLVFEAMTAEQRSAIVKKGHRNRKPMSVAKRKARSLALIGKPWTEARRASQKGERHAIHA